jgi:hypothetical protein
LALALAIILYALVGLHSELSGHGVTSEITQYSPELGGQVEDMAKGISEIFYSVLIAVAIGAQGGLALYYFSRRQHLANYLQQTPSWIIEMQKSGVSI